MRGNIMKKADDSIVKDDLCVEYDFASMAGGVQGKYTQRFKEGTNLVRLEPDIAEVFRDEAAVNRVLRSLIEVARNQVPFAK